MNSLFTHGTVRMGSNTGKNSPLRRADIMGFHDPFFNLNMVSWGLLRPQRPISVDFCVIGWIHLPLIFVSLKGLWGL